ncbi:SDR family oxidoreductase [Gordonia soli]|uniref:Putative 3-alpha-(Or 20-beta)-hydroxysteroid dehydrogenase n=1 Tax=Gordonia soli NBRC 108243 TaxID=1223545 RepID=M0QQX2_9ACTN|nr:SDR family oxidoreductase [Gordonia soli]GAC70973.1 putative 3-alpha-(or 20-beta)-hydroxysteroid dehydrogenase [Gordonia soli NBRC 108243]
MGFTPDTLDGGVVLISGGARGMGAAHARAIVDAGGRVVVGDIDVDGVRSVADSLGDAARAVELDVTDESHWARAVAEAADLGPVHGLVNNAGIFGTGSVLDAELDDFQAVQRVNVDGTLLGIRAVAPVLRDAGGGSIVNVSSIAGLIGIHDRAAYVTAKWAVRGLTHAAAIDLGEWHIRVNSIHPGRIATPFIDGLDSQILPNQIIKEPGQAEDVSALVVFLLSDASRFSTGSEFIADGGRFVGEYRR